MPRNLPNPNGVGEGRLIDEREFNTRLAQMRSATVITRVTKLMSPEERRTMLAAYQDDGVLSGPLSTDEVIAKNRRIESERNSFIAVIKFSHPNKELAARATDYFITAITRAEEEELTDELFRRYGETKAGQLLKNTVPSIRVVDRACVGDSPVNKDTAMILAAGGVSGLAGSGLTATGFIGFLVLRKKRTK